MNKFLSIALLFSSISYADIDIGDDFEDEFGAKTSESIKLEEELGGSS